MIQNKIMLGFIKKMFIGLLSACTIGSFGDSFKMHIPKQLTMSN